MSKKTGYCIRQDKHALVGAAVRSYGQGWRIEGLHHGSPEEPLTRDLQEAMVEATTPVTWLLNDGESSMSHIATPKLKNKALERALVGGLARDEGGQPDDWRVTWQALSGDDGPGDRKPYIVHYAGAAIVNEKRETAKDWGIDLQRMLPAHLALDLFYRSHGPERDEHAVWNLVFVGENQHFLSVSTRDSQLVMRNLPANLSPEKDDPEYLDRLATEIDRSAFFARQTEHSPEVEKIVVCGDPQVAGPLVKRLSESSGTPAVHWPIEELFEWGINEQHPDDLVVLAGAVLALKASPFNLLPERSGFRLNRRMRRQVLVAVGTCAAALVPLLLAGGVLTSRIQGTYLARAESRLTEAKTKALEAERAYETQRILMARENTIRRFANTRPDFESVLLQLAEITPTEVVFKDLQVRERPDGRFRLNLKGESRASTGTRAQGAFLEFLQALDGCGFLKRIGDPRLMQMIPGQAEAETGKRTVFNLELEWRNPDKGDG